MKYTDKQIKEYCTGCGLCAALDDDVTLVTDNNGFVLPLSSDLANAKGVRYCAAFGKNTECYDLKNIWGKYLKCYIGCSSDYEIRKKASSGGVLSSIAIYLLEKGMVDGIIHSVKDPDYPWRTITVCSRSADEIQQGMGSRYSQSSPLKDIFSIINLNEKYAFIGKPCDVAVLRNYMSDYPEFASIKYMLSFFCAGTPSEKANKKLLELLGTSTDDVKDLNYRGNGWPGFATAVDKSGRIGKMEYEKSWGQILGRDIRKICRFCMDGVGEFADIACGDAWFIKDRVPDFSEHEGRNVVLARNKMGKELLESAAKDGYVRLIEDEQYIDVLKICQKYQYERRATMFDKIFAMRLFGRKTPDYSISMLKKVKSDLSIKRRFDIFKGTIKRIMMKKI